MTPHAFAKRDCANHELSGDCLMHTPAALLGFSLPLPPWMPEHLWHQLVADAKAQGDPSVHVRVLNNTPILQNHHDRQAALALPAPQRATLGRPYVFHFCPRCAQPIGCQGQLPHRLPGGLLTIGALCDDCADAVFPNDPTNCNLRNNNRCNYFEKAILPATPHSAPAKTYRRTHKIPAPNARPCPDCGNPMAPNRHFCQTCAHKRRKATKRAHHHARLTLSTNG